MRVYRVSGIVLIALWLVAAGTVVADDGTWAVDAHGYWHDSGNWVSGVIADGAGYTAYFPVAISADRTVWFDTSRTIGHLEFTANSNTWHVSDEGATLTLSDTGGTPTITINGTVNQDVFIHTSLSGSQGFEKFGQACLVLASDNSALSGDVIVRGGVLYVDTGEALNSNTSLVIDGWSEVVMFRDYGSSSCLLGGLSGAGKVIMADGYTISVGGGNQTTEFFGYILRSGGDGGALTKVGTGTLTLLGANEHRLGTNVDNGTLRVTGADERLDDFGPVTVAPGAIFLVDGITETIGPLEGNGQVELDSGVLRVGHDGDVWQFSGQITGTGDFKLGGGDFFLVGSSDYTGDTWVENGKLWVAYAEERLPDATVVTVEAGAAFDVQGFIETIGGLAGTGDVLVDNMLRLGGGDVSADFDGQISGGGELVKVGTGTITLSGTNTHTGGTTLVDGKLGVWQDASLGHPGGGALTFDGGILQINGSSFTNLSRTIAWNSGGGFDIADPANTFMVAHDFSGSAGLRKYGPGTLVLSGDNSSYMGTVSVVEGTLSALAEESLGLDTDVAISAGAMLQNQSSQAFGGLGGEGTVDLNGFGLSLGNDDEDSVFAGVISGTGSVTKVGVGTLTLTGANTYSGVAAAVAGTLRIGGADERLPDDSSVTVMGGTFHVDGITETIASFGGAGPVQNDGVLQVGYGDATFTFDGNFTGTGDLKKIGTGTYHMAGDSAAYGGKLYVDEGTLDMCAGAFRSTLMALGANTNAWVVQSGGHMNVAGAAYFGTYEGGNGSYELSGAGQFSANALHLGNAGGATVLQSGGTCTIGGDMNFGLWSPGSAVYTLSGGDLSVSGTMNLDHQGSGTFNFSGGTLSYGAIEIGTPSTMNVGVNWMLDNPVTVAGGLLDAAGQTLTMNSNGAMHLENGTIVAGTIDNTVGATFEVLGGALQVGTFQGNLLNGGATLAPGGSPGTTTVQGDYTQQSAATLDMELGGTTPGSEFDQVTVTGTANLAGTLDISLINGFVPQPGDSFVVLTAGSVSGTFDTVTGTNLPGGGELTVVYSPTAVSLVYFTPGHGSWAFDADGYWSDPANWVGGFVANGVGKTATFDLPITDYRFVTLDADRQIGHLYFNSGGYRDWYIEDPDGQSHTLTMVTTTGTPTITVEHSAVIYTSLSGSQGFIKQGPGVLSLNSQTSAHVNDYTGVTTVSEGGLNVRGYQTLGAAGPGNGTVVQDGASVHIRSRSCSEAFTITGDGPSGDGAMKFYNEIWVYDLSITLDGNASLGGESDEGAQIGGPVALPDSALLTLVDAEAFHFYDVISGTGGITSVHASLILEGANTYSGPTTILDWGYLVLHNDHAVQNSTVVLTYGALRFDDDVTAPVLGGLAGVDEVDLSHSYGTPVPRTVTVGNNDESTTHSGAISGVGSELVKIGTGTLTLSGTNTYNAGTTINEGVLVADSDSALGSGDVDLDGGTLRITDGVGTLTVSGDYRQQPGAVLDIEIGGATPGTEHDQVNISGPANLAGELHLTLIDDYWWQAGQEYVIITAGSVSGTFDSVVGPGDFIVSYNDDNVTIAPNCAPGDLDCDGDVDLDDFNAFASCLSGPDVAPPGGCEGADLDGDADVDVADFASFQRSFTGP